MAKGRFIHVLLLALVVSADAFAQTATEPPSSWTRVVTLELVAPQTNKGGHPWDAGLDPFLCFPGSPLCAGTARVGGAPDMLLTIIDADGTSVGYQRNPPPAAANQGLFRTLMNPAEVSSLSRCPEASVCSYPSIHVPTGAFGVIVLDQDMKEHDFMLAGIIYEPNKADDVTLDRIEEHVHAFLDDLKSQRKLAGGPAGNEIPVRASSDCVTKVCFLDELAGIAGVRLSLTPPSTKGVPCAESTISGTLGWIDAERVIEFRFEPKTNACRGTLEFEWEFGDDEEAITADGSVSHRYDRPGDYDVTVTAACAQLTRSCQTKPVTKTIQIH